MLERRLLLALILASVISPGSFAMPAWAGARGGNMKKMLDRKKTEKKKK